MKRLIHPKEVWLEPIVRGDTWNGLESLRFEVDDQAPEASLAAVEITFREYSGSPEVGLFLSTAGGQIVIVDAAQWHVKILPVHDVDFDPADWVGDVRTTDENGVRDTDIRLMLPVRETSNRP